MATVFKSNKLKGKYLISYGPLGKYLGYYYIARPYNRPGNEIILGVKNNLSFSDFRASGVAYNHLG